MSDPATWFRTRTVHDDIWAISDNGGSLMYLVCGRDRALLIDTGWGVGDLPALIASLTPLPTMVVNTHVHPDHALGNPQFAEVHIPKDDFLPANMALEADARDWVLRNVVPQPLPPDFDAAGWGTAMPASAIPIEDGHCFELGQRSLQVIAAPGHSPGSICLLDRHARALFTGDTVLSNMIWMHLDTSCSLRQYADSLRKLREFSGEFEAVFSGHDELRNLPCAAHLVDELLEGAESILDGRLVGAPEHTFAGDGLRADFGRHSIIYRADRLQ